MAGGDDGMDNSNRALNIGDDTTKEELEANAKLKEQERLAVASAAEEGEAAKQAVLAEDTQKKAAEEAYQEKEPVSEDEQPVLEPALEVDNEKPEEMNDKPDPEPLVVETKETPAPEPPVVEPKKVEDDTMAHCTEIQAEGTGGCCVFF